MALREKAMRCLTPVLSLDGTLGKKATELRTQYFAFTSVGLCAGIATFMTTMGREGNQPIAQIASLTIILGLFIGLCAVLCRVPLTTGFVVSTLYMMASGVLMGDLNSRTLLLAQWPLLVLIIDMLLVMQVPTRYTLGLVCFIVLWLSLLGLEETFRFGLFELPGLAPQEGKYGRLYLSRERTDCSALPCPVPFPSPTMLGAASVFVIDFIVTRGFAHEVLKEQESMEQTINAVQEIASLLAKYDVEGVSRLLVARSSELPEQMYTTLQTMEQNLRLYRPYLPAALFEELDDEKVKHMSVAPPGVESETATIVFTDIRASTSIWENAPEGMRAGLKIHNTAMRETMAMFGGYEVKTIGDAFMVAFSTTQDGVNFGLHVHELLRDASWPASLLEDAPICAEQGSLWGGLTVRIGVNTGPVTIEQNTLTGRTDYFGHTVNVAARLESTCKPGAVAIPSDLYTSDCRSCSAVVGDSEALDLKGVSGTTCVQCLWPLSLAGRMQSPLKEPSAENALDNRDSVGSISVRTTSSSICYEGNPMQQASDATIGTVHLTVQEECSPPALRHLSLALSILTVSLDQSGGTLVTLLGSRVCVGWNLIRPTPGHMENAVHFIQRLLGTAVLSGAGLVTGSVQHGDVGARKQRFVTVMGQTVYRSWALCDTAKEGRQCLYEPPLGTSLPAALKLALEDDRRTHGVYRILPTRSREHS